MPSKNNKRKAAAERSAALAALAAAAAEQTAGVPEAIPSSTPTSTVSTQSAPPSGELSALSISGDASTAPVSTQVSTSTPSAPIMPPMSFKPPTKLVSLKKTQTIKVITNSYELDVKRTSAYRYDVKVTKYVDGIKESFELAGSRGGDRQRQADLAEILKIAMKEKGLNKIKFVYDGAATLFSPLRFENERKGGIDVTIDSKDLPENLKQSFFSRDARGRIEVFIESNSKQSQLNSSNLLKESLDSTACPVTQMTQIALCEEAKRAGFLIADGGNEMFNKSNTIQQGNGVEEMHGIGAGIKIAEGKQKVGAAHLIVDYKKKQFFVTGPLASLGLDWLDISSVRHYLRGLRVHTTYSNQSIVIDDVSNEPIGNMSLDGKPLLENCARVSGKRVNQFNPRWPAIQSKFYHRREKKRVTYSFPIENLVLSPNQKLTQKHGNPPICDLPHARFNLTKSVGEAAHILSPNPTLEAFGISVLHNPIVVDAIVVKAPVILYKGGTTTVPNLAKKAKWEVQSKGKSGGGGLVKPAEMMKSILILYNSSVGSGYEKLFEFESSLFRTAQDLGIKTVSLQIHMEDLGMTHRGCTVEEAIEKKMTSLKSSAAKPTVIYADFSGHPTHGCLKLQERLCNVVTQQLSMDKSLKKPGKSTMFNIMMKLNLKNGGLNHKVMIDPIISHLWGDSSNTLVISYDVCHSAGKVYRKDEICEEPSCVGFGFNGTETPEAIIGDFHYQLPRQEQVDESVLIKRAKLMVNHYFNSRKKLPDNIIVLRDGVSEGQHRMVLAEEFPAIQKGVMEVFNAQKKKAPAYALLIVTKRHSNRLYTKNEQGISNVPALTAIDEIIVRKNGNELIFVSHCPINGTAQPIVITTLLNESVFKTNDEMVRFMAVLCCSHQTSTTIVSLPETIYAADEYAKRGADIFQAYKLKCDAERVTLPKTKDGTQLDFMEITRTLCYQTSSFKQIRIA